MSEITRPVMLDETGKLIADNIERQNLLITRLIEEGAGATPIETLHEIHHIVQSGRASSELSEGDQINLNYKNGDTNYVLPWDILGFGDFELEDGEVKPGMAIQSHYAMQPVQFSASQAAYVCASSLVPGTYNFIIGTTWGSNCVANKSYQFTTTTTIPANGQIVIGKNNSFYTWGAPDQSPSNWRVYTFSDSSSHNHSGFYRYAAISS